MMDDTARKLAMEQRRRLVAGVMQCIEERAYPSMPPAERQVLRTEVLDRIGSYHDFVLDLIKIGAESPHSDEVLRLVRLIHSKVD